MCPQLAGARIAVTRASHQAPPLADIIREFGGAPILFPCIAIKPAIDLCPLDDCLARIEQYDWLLVTSGNAARALAFRLQALNLSLARASIQVAAVGPATAEELRQRLACEPRFVPVNYGAEELARSLPIRPALPNSAAADGPGRCVDRADLARTRRGSRGRGRLPDGPWRGRGGPAGHDRTRRDQRAHLYQPVGGLLLLPALFSPRGAPIAGGLHWTGDGGTRPGSRLSASGHAETAQPARHGHGSRRAFGAPPRAASALARGGYAIGFGLFSCADRALVKAHQCQSYYHV